MSKLYIGNKLILNPDDKLEKVELTQAEYDALTTKKDNILYLITDADNPLEELTDKVDKHLQNITTGLNHIPDGGHERQILTWQSNGKAKWEDMATVFTGMEELLAYGVQWSTTSADPHLTRIGNMSLHKTLPIQSQLKGCIAQEDKVMYWLWNEDWHFKDGDINNMPIDLSTPDNVDTIVKSDNSLTFTASETVLAQSSQLNNKYAKIRIVSNNDESEPQYWDFYATITINDSTVTLIFDTDPNTLFAKSQLPNDTTLFSTIITRYIGEKARLDGYDGTVRIYVPNFYIKSVISGSTRKVWISSVKIDNSWEFQHECLIDANKCTILTEVPEDMGYLSTLPANSAVSIINTSTYCRGGNNSSNEYDKYLTGADNTTIDIFRSDLGKPVINTSINDMRTYAHNAGSDLLSYCQYKNILYWLYVIEYANFNAQEIFMQTATADGYKQGGLSQGVTLITSSHWDSFNGKKSLVPCGFGNYIGNKTSTIQTTLNFSVDGEDISEEITIPRWRGFDNPFGDIGTNLDGILVNCSTNDIYICKDPNQYDDEVTDDYSMISTTFAGNGLIKHFNLGNQAHIIPSSSQNSDTEYKCDMKISIPVEGITSIVMGGRAHMAGFAGLSMFEYNSTESIYGYRTISRFVSFNS